MSQPEALGDEVKKAEDAKKALKAALANLESTKLQLVWLLEEIDDLNDIIERLEGVIDRDEEAFMELHAKIRDLEAELASLVHAIGYSRLGGDMDI